MKKNLLIIVLMITVALASCTKLEIETIASITVKENSVLQKNATVYMFDHNSTPGSNFFKPLYADKKVVTSDNGVAVFKLEDVKDLSPTSNQTTLYFAVFDVNNILLGNTALTIEKEQSISKEISY